MRFLTLFIVFSWFLTSGFYSHYSHAQQHISHCDLTESTASAQACLKKHLDEAQDRLNEVYEELSSTLETEDLQELKRLQQNWLTYRDEECAWEAGRTETASLQQVYELSCKARLTESRAEQLEITLADMEEPGVQRQFGTFPRWVNVVAKDYPDIFWKYGQRQSMDLDCDEIEEYVMAGVILKPYKTDTQDEKDSQASLLHTAEVAVVVAENPAIGRPQTSLFKYPVSTHSEEQVLCAADVTLTPFEKSERKVETEDETAGSEVKKECRAGLKIQTGNCTPIHIHWTGKGYDLWSEEDKAPENK